MVMANKAYGINKTMENVWAWRPEDKKVLGITFLYLG
jgi:hypothetical protein